MSRRLWNDGWEFQLVPVGTDAAEMLVTGAGWERIEMPHDWQIFDAENLYGDGDGWYRKSFQYEKSAKREDVVCGETVALCFEGVYMNSEYYLNGQKVFEWKYGYSTHEVDLTDYVKDGENVLHVRVRYESPNSRWYSGAGIYRNVYVLERPVSHLVSNGIYVHTEAMGANYRVDIQTEVTEGEELVVEHLLYAPDGELVSRSCGRALTGKEMLDKQSLSVAHPFLWDIESPYLYTLKTVLHGLNGTLDVQSQKIGFRKIVFDTEQGLFLNDRHIKLFGACEHHDLGCFGAAFRMDALRRQFEELKKMGINALRTSHNMPAKEFMELADEMGFLVDAEAFDMWERNKTKYDYACYFKEWYKKDVASWVRRDRNHACLLFWSIGNEIYDTHADEHGREITEYLRDEVRVHDPLCNAPVTIGSNYMPWENAQKCADVVKYAGYNYAEKYYEEHHKEHPDWYIYGSETASTTQSRGIYRFPYAEPVLCDDDEQCSSLGNSTTSWGAKSTEYCITMDRDAKFSLGQFIWTGFDYIGEPTPYSTKNSYLGQIDTAGFWKDAAYLYQAEWTDWRKAPMVHIYPYWDFSVGQLTDVRVCSNACAVELFLNGVSQGRYEIDHANGQQLTGNWQIPYVPGVLTAVAYDPEGNEVARESEYSFGDPTKVCLTANRSEITANGTDLIFVEIEVEDCDGHPVRNARNRVKVEVTGAGRLVGMDNGDSTDYDQYKATSRRLFSGKALAVIASNGEPGEISVKATSVGLTEAVLTLTAKPRKAGETAVSGTSDYLEDNVVAETRFLAKMEKEKGAAAVAAWKAKMATEVPVRRIDISCNGERMLTNEQKEVELTAKILPENATYRDVLWRLTSNGGVDANFAELVDLATGKKSMSRPNGVKLGERVKLIANGDGAFKVRCNSTNGEEKIRVISELEFSISGLGQTAFDPYGFVAGALYSGCIGTVTNGNEHGVATMRDGKTTVYFEHVDFGEFGSDEVTLPIFELDNRPTPVEIWEGIPGEEDSVLVDTVVYNKPSIWNTYQEETFVLPRRFCGLTTISFVFEHKVHLKGFSFTKKTKALEQLYAAEYSSIYGDSYQKQEKAVVGIGNNVTIGFDGMDFGAVGVNRIVICGKTALPVNTVHVRFRGEYGDVNKIAEFVQCNEYTEQVFDIGSITGKNTVNFVFMPGCEFDFLWFRFLLAE